MRSRRVLVLVLALLAPLAGCLTPHPTAADWLDIGFRTPEQTFGTWQTAFATDSEDLEYRCLSVAMKQRLGIDSATYRIARDELLRSVPGLKRVAAAEIRRAWALTEERWRLVAQVEFLWIDRFIQVDLVREEFFELYRGDRRVLDGLIDFDAIVVLDDSTEPPILWAGVDAADPLGLAPAVTPATVDELRVGREWKIDALVSLEERAAEALLAAAP